MLGAPRVGAPAVVAWSWGDSCWGSHCCHGLGAGRSQCHCPGFESRSHRLGEGRVSNECEAAGGSSTLPSSSFLAQTRLHPWSRPPEAQQARWSLPTLSHLPEVWRRVAGTLSVRSDISMQPQGPPGDWYQHGTQGLASAAVTGRGKVLFLALDLLTCEV